MTCPHEIDTDITEVIKCQLCGLRVTGGLLHDYANHN